MTSRNKLILSAFLILFLQLIVFIPSFNLAIFGDDWLTLWRYLRVVKEDTYSQGYNIFTYFLTPYGPQDIVFGLIYDLFKLNPIPYYIISFIFRYSAALSIFYVIFKLTKSNIAALAAGSFFATTIVGLDTTNWIFNMPSYLGAIFVSFFLYFLITGHRENNRSLLLLGYFFLLLAMLIAPIRMHGAIPLIIAFESFWIVLNRNKKAIYFSFLSLFSFIAVFLIVRSIGTSLGNPAEPFQRIGYGFNTMQKMIYEDNQKEVLLHPLIIYGNMVVPEELWQNVDKLVSFNFFGRTRKFPVLSVAALLGFLFLLNARGRFNKNKKDLSFYIFPSGGFLLIVLTYFLYKNNPLTFSSLDRFGAGLVGGLFLIFLVSRLFFLKIPTLGKLGLLAAVILPFCFIGYPWIFTPYTIFPAAHRYMLFPAIGIALSWGFLFAYDRRLFIIISFVLILTGNMIFTYRYLHTLTTRRGIKIAEKVWEPVNTKLPKISANDGYYVVYFEPDNKNGDIVHANLSFGFPPRMSLRDNIIDEYKIPVAISVYDELIGIVTTGEPLLAHAKKVEPLPVERIFAFKINGEEAEDITVTDITEEIRNDLRRKTKEF